MSNANGPGTTTTSTVSRRKWGGMVFFKVEEIIFEVPRYRFSESSEVFETMFDLPPGSEGNVEGRDEGHPIVLEGYEAAHFDALLKVLYPTPDDLISGTFKLEKEEWIGVLNLSTRWSMKRIRKHAIDELSKIPLDLVEKVALAREHKVAKWFRDGVNDLVSEHPIRPLAELKSRLGIEMACALLWIQAQRPQERTEKDFAIALCSLGCPSCFKSVFHAPLTSWCCNRSISVADYSTIRLLNGTSGTFTYSANRFQISLKLTSLRCSSCLDSCPIDYRPDYHCSSCNSIVAPSNFRLINPLHRNRAIAPELNVSEMLKEEIASYESWDD
ncbi:hypothetical protein H1R20_g4760, partial [Candolleomyces eurysporus]